MNIYTTFNEKNGKPWLQAIGVTNEVVSDAELDMLHENSIGQYVHWRHQTPAKGSKGMIFGICRDKELKTFKNDAGKEVRGLDLGFELLTLTEEHESAIAIVKKYQELGKPIGISVGKQKFTTKDGKVMASFPFDWSITDVPHDINTHTGEITYMEDKEKVKLEKEILELRKTLDVATGKLEAKDEDISKLKVKTDEYEQKLKDKVGTLNSAFEAELTKVTTKFEGELSTMQNRLDMSEKKSVLTAIAEFEDEYLIKNFYASQSVEELEKRLVELEENREKTTAPRVESFERSRQTARKKGMSSIMAELEKNDPELANMIKKGEY